MPSDNKYSKKVCRMFNVVALHSGRVHYGGGDKTVPKSLEGCSMDMFPKMVKE